MGAPAHLVASEFKEKVERSTVPVLVDFWAEWCGPCKAIAPHIEAIAREYAGRVNVYKVNVDEEPDLAMRFDIMSIPTLVIFKDGEEFDRIIGLVPKEQIISALERALK
ncbi:MAG TPA: thioredoxin [Fimbriimonadales bacterium]|nr:thioredoxin [Fimbriimonadales bacterium]